MLRTFLVAGLTLASLASADEPGFDWPERLEWTPRFVGIDETDLTLTLPRPLRVHALRVDLQANGVTLATDRSNGPAPEEVDGCLTSTFLVRRGCVAAINGAPFWPGQPAEDLPQNVVGLVVEAGELVSPIDEAKPREALVVRGDTAAIEAPPIDLKGVTTAVGGFGVVLLEGAPHRDATESTGILDDRHPRTGVGVSADGRTLLLVVVDGRQPGYSEGVDLAELGELMRRFGASDAMNLDGGGTSTMVVTDGAGGFRLVNRPIEAKVPGRERVSASHLGVCAKPLP